jgi:hypothetical protein
MRAAGWHHDVAALAPHVETRAEQPRAVADLLPPRVAEEEVGTPPPVRDLAVVGTGLPKRSSFTRLSDPPASGSTSRTTTPLSSPVGIPTLAEGHRPHHRLIARGSVVASQWPFRVSGLLAPGSQGNTGTPRPA